jgi:hypothetical protein
MKIISFSCPTRSVCLRILVSYFKGKTQTAGVPEQSTETVCLIKLQVQKSRKTRQAGLAAHRGKTQNFSRKT